MKVLLAILAFVPQLATAASCEGVKSLVQTGTTITLAQPVSAGAFTPPVTPGGRGGNVNAFKNLPAFCRVAATLKPTSDSDIRIEVWLPESGWNGKLESAGNGGWAGTISYPAMATALAAGYATASTDTGHAGGNADEGKGQGSGPNPRIASNGRKGRSYAAPVPVPSNCNL